jgi:hypothetical protein
MKSRQCFKLTTSEWCASYRLARPMLGLAPTKELADECRLVKCVFFYAPKDEDEDEAYIVHLSGNANFSYSYECATKEMAEILWDTILEMPSIDLETIKAMGFTFAN